MNARAIFFEQGGRLRSGWRFAIFLTFFIASAMLFGSVGVALLLALGLPSGSGGSYLIANAVLTLIPALLIGWLCGKILEGLPFRALGAWFTKGWATNFLIGIVAGALTLVVAVLIAFVFGGLRFTWTAVDGAAIARSLAISFAIFAVAAAAEEALFRGYILQTFARSGLAWLGIALTSLFFGVVHGGNPNATVISTVDTVLAGIWFGVAYLKTRDLWFVWGLHLMWNWMQGSVFGIEVSGLTDITAAPLLKEIDHGPEWLTGTTYGIEGGLASTIALILSTAVIWFSPWPKADEELVELNRDRSAAAANRG